VVKAVHAKGKADPKVIQLTMLRTKGRRHASDLYVYPLISS